MEKFEVGEVVDVFLNTAGRKVASWVPGTVVRVNPKRLVLEVEYIYLEPSDKKDIFGRLVRGVFAPRRGPKQITVKTCKVRKRAPE